MDNADGIQRLIAQGAQTLEVIRANAKNNQEFTRNLRESLGGIGLGDSPSAGLSPFGKRIWFPDSQIAYKALSSDATAKTKLFDTDDRFMAVCMATLSWFLDHDYLVTTPPAAMSAGETHDTDHGSVTVDGNGVITIVNSANTPSGLGLNIGPGVKFPVTGDFDVSAHVTAMTHCPHDGAITLAFGALDTSPRAAVGVTLNFNVNGDHYYAFAISDAQGTQSTAGYVAVNPHTVQDIYLRLVRVANRYIGFMKWNAGDAWTYIYENTYASLGILDGFIDVLWDNLNTNVDEAGATISTPVNAAGFLSTIVPGEFVVWFQPVGETAVIPCASASARNVLAYACADGHSQRFENYFPNARIIPPKSSVYFAGSAGLYLKYLLDYTMGSISRK